MKKEYIVCERCGKRIAIKMKSKHGYDETLKAIRRIAIDASNYCTDNFAPVNEIREVSK